MNKLAAEKMSYFTKTMYFWRLSYAECWGNIHSNLDRRTIHESSQLEVFLKIDVTKSKQNPWKILLKKLIFRRVTGCRFVASENLKASQVFFKNFAKVLNLWTALHF